MQDPDERDQREGRDEDAVGLDLEQAPTDGAEVRPSRPVLLLVGVPDAWSEPFLCHL